MKLPGHVIDALRRGLDLAAKGRAGDGLQGSTREQARKGVADGEWSEDKIVKAAAWFARHESSKTPGWDKRGEESPGFVAWLLWGDSGNGEGRASIERLAAQVKRDRGELSEGYRVEAVRLYEAAELVEGKPFACLACGKVARRQGGDDVVEVTEEMLADVARLINERGDADPVVIDWQHMSEPDNPAPPELGAALGVVKPGSARIVDGRLEVVPLYTERGARTVRESQGVLWSSPSLRFGEIHARDGSGPMGATAQMVALTLTPRPAQQADRLTPVRLAETSEGGAMNPEEVQDEMAAAEVEIETEAPDMEAQLATALERIAALEEENAKLRAMKATEANLTEKVKRLEAAVLSEREARLATECARDVDALLSDGVPPARRAALLEAWPMREKHPALWAALTERVVPQGRSGSTTSAPADIVAAARVALSEASSIEEGTARLWNDNPEAAAAVIFEEGN